MKLQRREPDSPSNPQGPGTTLIIAVVFVGFLFSSLFFYITLRYIRRAHPTPPRFFPEKWKQKWTAWNLNGYDTTTSSAQSPSPPPPSVPASLAARNARARERLENRDRRRREQSGIIRGESVRSVMTLPEYRAVALPDREVTIGREGERGGIDVVIEAPETADEEEQRREEHMQSLYEIRLARQLERAAERETAQNGGRGSARSRGGNSSSVTSLAAALAAIQERERRLSEVSYAEVGLARPDGTRVRMSSETFDRDSLPLLDSGAPMGMGSIRSGRSSHGRTNSAISMDSMGPGSPERRRSDEIFRMGSARPSMDDRDSGPLDESDRPPGYAGPDWGAPPEYPGATGDDGPRGGGVGIPVVRIETSSPDPFPPVHLRP